MGNLLPLREVERRLGLSRWNLYGMIHSGRLEAVKLASGQYRVPERAAEAISQGLAEGGENADQS